jgi:hypothetical protein
MKIVYTMRIDKSRLESPAFVPAENAANAKAIFEQKSQQKHLRLIFQTMRLVHRAIFLKILRPATGFPVLQKTKVKASVFFALCKNLNGKKQKR